VDTTVVVDSVLALNRVVSDGSDSDSETETDVAPAVTVTVATMVLSTAETVVVVFVAMSAEVSGLFASSTGFAGSELGASGVAVT
jgi:hypothetical protein